MKPKYRVHAYYGMEFKDVVCKDVEDVAATIEELQGTSAVIKRNGTETIVPLSAITLLDNKTNEHLDIDEELSNHYIFLSDIIKLVSWI